MPIQKLALLLRGSTRYDRKLDSAAVSIEAREAPGKHEMRRRLRRMKRVSGNIAMNSPDVKDNNARLSCAQDTVHYMSVNSVWRTESFKMGEES